MHCMCMLPVLSKAQSLTRMYSNLPEMVPDTSPAWGAVALFIGLAGLKGLSLSCPGAPGSAFSLHGDHVKIGKVSITSAASQHANSVCATGHEVPEVL